MFVHVAISENKSNCESPQNKQVRLETLELQREVEAPHINDPPPDLANILLLI